MIYNYSHRSLYAMVLMFWMPLLARNTYYEDNSLHNSAAQPSLAYLPFKHELNLLNNRNSFSFNRHSGSTTGAFIRIGLNAGVSLNI